MIGEAIGTGVFGLLCWWFGHMVGYDRAQRRFDKPDPLTSFVRAQAMKVKATRQFIPDDCVVTSENFYELDGERYELLIRKGGK